MVLREEEEEGAAEEAGAGEALEAGPVPPVTPPSPAPVAPSGTPTAPETTTTLPIEGAVWHCSTRGPAR